MLPGPQGTSDPRYPAEISTRLYPEAAFAVVGNVEEHFVAEVTQQLLAIVPGSEVAAAATVAGFTAPLSYVPVRDLMEELRLGPFERFGQLTFFEALQQHSGKVTLALLGFLSIISLAFARTRRLNTQLHLSLTEQKHTEQERARLEQQLQQSQRMDSIGRLAGAVAHDFNNLLTVINGYSEIALTETREHDSTRRSLVQIQKAGHRAAELTQQLLTFSKKQIAQPVPLNINTVVHESVTMFRRLLGEDIHLVTHASPSTGLTLADPAQMHQVLMNLVRECPRRDATGRHADDIHRGRRDHRRHARLDWRDPTRARTCCCPSATQGSVWMPGRWSTSSSRSSLRKERLEPASGSRRSTESCGRAREGFQSRANPAAEQPSRSFCRAPRINRSDLPRTVPRPVSPPSGPGTLLVVEDQDDVRGFATAVLRSAGYEVLEAASGDEALSLADRHGGRIQLLLTDVVLPGMNGRELSEQFRRRHPDARMLFTSGYADDVIARRGVLQGSIAFLPKPYSSEQLLAKVRTVLDHEN